MKSEELEITIIPLRLQTVIHLHDSVEELSNTQTGVLA